MISASPYTPHMPSHSLCQRDLYLAFQGFGGQLADQFGDCRFAYYSLGLGACGGKRLICKPLGSAQPCCLKFYVENAPMTILLSEGQKILFRPWCYSSIDPILLSPAISEEFWHVFPIHCRCNGCQQGNRAATAIAFAQAGYDVCVNYHFDGVVAGIWLCRV
ncbi:hypothetical protein LP421_02230 (plasmid) [Rhizobium sp. RCAM05350]|nr:hypothetical protein LP421_02230 [Rhizobium sp. RCAM05350]